MLGSRRLLLCWLSFFLGFGVASSNSQSPIPAVAWKARWIAADAGPSVSGKPLPLFRREFVVSMPVRKATLYVSGLGQFEAHLNGRKVGDGVLTPGWTDYRKRVFYDTYDVTSMLRPGANAIGVLLGNGMYNVEQAEGRYTKFVGSFGAPKLILQLELEYSDGSRETVATDAGWQTSPGPITFSSVYGGEDYDARLEQPGWDRAGFAGSGWPNAVIVDGPGGALMPEVTPPIKVFESFEPVKVTHPASGVAVYDLGRNFAGWPEATVSGPRGASVKLVAGELLDASGRVTQKSANAFPNSENSFTYVLKGAAREQWTPRFSYWGFRYVEAISPAGQQVKIVHLRGRSLHDAVAVDGLFKSSDMLFNRIHLLIDRAMLSNMMSVLTDCPHREKLGWLEQTHLAGASLMYNYDLSALYAKIAGDMEDSQLPNGMVPSIAPVLWRPRAAENSLRWDEALCGLSQGTAQGQSTYVWAGRLVRHWSGRAGESQLTAKGITATAVYYQDLTTMARIALILGYPDDAAEFTAQSRAVRDAFNRQYFHPQSGEYDRGSQTANAMPLVVGLAPQESRSAVLANLIADIRQHRNHVTAGDVGFHYVVRALTDNGRSDVLFDMLSRTDKPSYGDQLARGATTLTEAWDANPNSSQNHFMLGHAEEWFYRGLAGIDLDMSRAADARIRIQPNPVGDMRSASASLQTRLGKVASGWTRAGGVLRLDVEIPRGTNATVVLPAAATDTVRVNGGHLRAGGAIRSVQAKGSTTVCVVAAGKYRFLISKHAETRLRRPA